MFKKRNAESNYHGSKQSMKLDDEDEDDSMVESDEDDEDDEEGSDEENSEESDELLSDESDELDDEESDDDECELPPINPSSIFSQEGVGRDSGCTANVALIKDNKLYVANAGDSRCVLCRNGQTIEMSFDHKPFSEIEHSRIVKAGGRVTSDGRVNGGLNLSRAWGDHAYKTNKTLPLEDQMITPLPDIKVIDILPEDEFIVLACDGIWNSMSSQEVVDYVKEQMKKEKVLSKICDSLFFKCLAEDTRGDGTGCDNQTCIIIKLKDLPGVKADKENNNELTEPKEIKIEFEKEETNELIKNKITEKNELASSDLNGKRKREDEEIYSNGSNDTNKKNKTDE